MRCCIVSLFGSVYMLLVCTSATGAERVSTPAIHETLNCSMIRVSELLYILENSARTQKDQRIRSWIVARVELQLKLMQLARLDRKQRDFVQTAKRRLAVQQ